MDFRFSPEQQAFQKEIRDFIHTEFPQELRWSERVAFTDSLWPAVLEARKKLAEKGWATMHWPVEYGGQGASHITQMLFVEEMSYWGVPQAIAFDDGPNLIGPTLMQFGSEHLQWTVRVLQVRPQRERCNWVNCAHRRHRDRDCRHGR